MGSSPSGGELFIVDNSISGWTGLEYLRQWCDIATSFDIATGFFEVGSLLALDGKWQQLQKIRVLMGDEMAERTRQALLEALRRRTESHLDYSLESEKTDNPFLTGVPAIVDALHRGQIECRIYNKEKFHAKAYITHAKFDVVGGQALVGSSNFTRPGLTQNVELNIRTQSGTEVAQLQEWFEDHWALAVDVTGDVARVVERHVHEFSPFDVYARALHELFRGHELSAGEWDETQSRMYPHLDLYQKEAYWALMKIASQHRGAFLCDGVGLGKTFVGLMLIERLILHENKRVALFAPKAAKESVWEPHLDQWLRHVGGIGGGADFSNLAVFSHTDLNRGGDFPDRFKRLSELADAVIIDEAHHFRNPGRRGNPDAPEDERSRYYRLFDMLDQSVRPKTLFMLTATPINNRLADFRHMTELFTRRDESYFARTLGINNLTAHFNVLEKELQRAVGGVPASLQEGVLEEAHDLLAGSVAFQNLVVQRSRAYARASQVQETGTAASFPERRPPQVAAYSVRTSYGRVLDLFEKAFEKESPLFSLPVYYPLAYYKGPDTTIDPFEENRQKQVVGLIRTQFLKRFESSVYAFERSLNTLMGKLLAFVEVHSETPAEKQRFDRWKRQHEEILGHHPERQLGLWSEDAESEDDDQIPQEFLESVTKLSRDEYDVNEMLQETFLDLDQIGDFLEETRQFDANKDDKLKKLVRLLKSKEMESRKVLIFTEFADTARYLETQLRSAGIGGVAEMDSTSGANRTDVIRRFSPYYNGSNSAELMAQGLNEISVLVSTDVLSEGLNLQDATRLINYDIHWNPVRLMQRIGRVDRRMNPLLEARLISDHPEKAGDRGKVAYWNFLPPDELNSLLSLYKRVTQKTLLISKTLGIEGKKLLTPEDDYDALREFNAAYEGTKTPVEDLHLEYQSLINEHPDLSGRMNLLPGGVFSGRKTPSKGAIGVFFCFALPALDQDLGRFTLEAGPVRWYLYELGTTEIIESPGEIANSIRSKPGTPRRVITDQQTLRDLRNSVLNHIKNSYSRRLDLPLDAPNPRLLCWMELNG
ncbi:MAG TPA: helicase-related protein [Acidimicrobiia bacterium]|nr:helicase-related protein [Acidimicrobiia bacterium]